MNDFSKLDRILNDYSDSKGTLIPILQKTQEEYGFLSQDAMKYIANHLKISEADVFGVATFYAQFRFMPVGKNMIKVCHGTACHVGGINILDAMLNTKLGIKPGETTKDGLFTIQHVACLGCCSLAPVIMINETTYGKLTNDKLTKIIDKYAEGKTI
jgi:NADH-quinone oxidoreductase subunit E